MRRLVAVTTALVLSGMLVSAAWAGQADSGASGKKKAPVKMTRVDGEKGQGAEKGQHRYSLDREYKKRVEQKKRAAEMRRTLMRNE